MNATRSYREKVVVAGLLTPEMDKELFEEDMHEMELLCDTAGAEVTGIFRQQRPVVVTGTYLGRGKLREIKSAMHEHGATTLVVDAHLAPGQVKAIEQAVQGKVIDRGQLILDIFAMHARTAEARLQVELAQMRILYPRLTHAWTHFSQQVGGIGTRGPGEKQLEVDRRLVKNRITDLKRKLEKIERGRVIQRGGRGALFKAAMVGYTNVGKSSLLNALCGSSVLVENKLFATLDTATRRSYIPGAGTIIISDTVGLLRKLPHHLIASFRSTLSEVSEAHLLLLVMDASSIWTRQQMATVEQVLVDLDAEKIPRLVVFNKIDLVDDPFTRKRLLLAWPDALFVSAFDKASIGRLKEGIAEAVRQFDDERRKDALIASTTRQYLPDER
jgi:GTP-binding protein HflX